MTKLVDILKILEDREINILQRALKSQDIHYSLELESKDLIEYLEIFHDYLREEVHVIKDILNDFDEGNSKTLENLNRKKEKHIQDYLLCDDIIWKIKMLNAKILKNKL